MASATLSFKTTFMYETTPGGGTYTAIAGVYGLSGPSPTVDDVEITDFDSTGFFKEFMAGLVDGGEVTIELRFAKADFATLYGFIRTTKNYKIRFPDGSTGPTLLLGSTWIAAMYLKMIGNEHALGKDIVAKCTFKVTGVPAFTVAT